MWGDAARVCMENSLGLTSFVEFIRQGGKSCGYTPGRQYLVILSLSLVRFEGTEEAVEYLS